MLLIRCPWCGDRAQIEFRYVGDASRRRPSNLEELPLDEWFDYVYTRPNPRGPHAEYWQHSSGCRQFVKVVRDTATHQVLGTYRSDEPTPLDNVAAAPGGDGEPAQGGDTKPLAKKVGAKKVGSKKTSSTPGQQG